MDKLLTQDALLFYAIALLAVISHAVVKWTRNEIVGSPINWFVDHPRATVGTVLAALGGTIGALTSFDAININSGAQIMAIWGIGYIADSSFNGQGR